MSTLSGIGGASSWSSTQAGSTARRPERPDPDKMFAKIDSDGSGAVDKTELQGMLDNMATRSGKTGKLSADELLAKADANGDGSLDKTELEQGMKSLMPAPSSTMAFAQARGGSGGPGGPPPPADGESTDTSTLDPLDSNQDGTVSEQERAAGEIKDAMKTLLKALSSEGGQQLLKQYAEAANTSARPATGSTLSVAA
nr:EF-hand domain-containing protein [uncultured Roseateles sp.]